MQPFDSMMDKQTEKGVLLTRRRKVVLLEKLILAGTGFVGLNMARETVVRLEWCLQFQFGLC